MLLTTGVFLFNLLCGLVPCDPKWKLPEVLEEPRDKPELERNVRMENLSPLVNTSAGALEGYLMRSMNGRNFFAFQGIYYGESTAGPNRWKPPVPKKAWRGIRQAKKPTEDCLQISVAKMLRVYGSEDCLSLNVYTPELPDPTRDINAKYPVIVFIHGGSFIMGSGSEHGPSYLLSEKNSPVVLVTLNYRLGVLGFMSTGDEALPGNYGLKDQALALKWVHENIEFFGGDKDRVSLWGNSAGAVSVHLHMIANKTRDYFSTAFTSSGTAFNHWGVQSKETIRGFTRRLAKQFRCQNEDSFTMVKCLERVNPYSLAGAQLQLFDWFPFPPVLLSPIVEPEHEDAFLTISPEDAYNEGTVAKKPLVVGMTKDEGKTAIMILLPLMKTFPLRVMWDQIAPYFLQYKNLVGNPDEITKRIEEFYFKGKSARQASLNDFAEMASDRYLSFGVIKGLQAHAQSGAPSYLYHFSFSDGNHNLADTIGYKSSDWGAGHSEDVFYFFNDSLLYDGQKQNDPDRQLSSVMINLMTNYAASGKPHYTTESGELMSIWDPVDNPSEIRALQLDKKVEMIPLPQKEVKRLKFWEELQLPNVTLWSPLT